MPKTNNNCEAPAGINVIKELDDFFTLHVKTTPAGNEITIAKVSFDSFLAFLKRRSTATIYKSVVKTALKPEGGFGRVKKLYISQLVIKLLQEGEYTINEIVNITGKKAGYVTAKAHQNNIDYTDTSSAEAKLPAGQKPNFRIYSSTRQ